MKLILDSKDVLMSGGVLAGFELDDTYANGLRVLNDAVEKELLERLRRSPALAADLLSREGPIIYMGAAAGARDAEGGTLGMRFRDGGSAVEGDNVYGKMLMRVRNAYLAELVERNDPEVPVDPSKILVDHAEPGAERTWTEEMEEQGRSFLHTEPYRPVKWRFDSNRSGVTGFARRASSSDVAFQTFECPFGVDARSRIRVGSAAEASLLYERALRRELDWEGLFKDLAARGLVKGMGKRDVERTITDLRAQFDWMRERICRDSSLAGTPIVASSLLVPDASFGRSVYDPETAPSPAHVLARYINNPLLLFSRSENGVLRALEMADKNEPYRFSDVRDGGMVTIVIDGSDTIGGRVPGTRAVRERRPVFVRDNEGRVVYGVGNKPLVSRTEEVYRLQLKTDDEVDADYAVFRDRLSAVLSNISAGTPVRLLTSSSVGTPQMVRRFVQEHGGACYDWDYTEGRAKPVGEAPDGDSLLSQVRLPHFRDVVPLLLGEEDAVSFRLDENDDASLVVVGSDSGLRANGWATFSIDADARNAELLQRGSRAVAAGVPVVHVQQNASEEEQALSLSSENSRVRDVLSGEVWYEDSLFTGEPRVQWDLDTAQVFSEINHDMGLALPYVSYLQSSGVFVNGISYHSAYSVYAAMLLRESGEQDVKAFRELARNEDSMAALAEVVAKVDLPDQTRERCMRNAVHLMAQASPVFADYLLSAGTGDLVCVSSFGGQADFVDLAGRGENRFGVVLSAERDRMLSAIDEERKQAEALERHIAEENVRLQRRADKRRAPGEKMTGGLPADIASSQDAIWFLGTDRPAHLMLPDGQASFMQWEEREYGHDALNRELASRMSLDDGEGGLVDNNMVFLFPSDQLATTGRRHVVNNPDSKDLTGVTRVNPATGQRFVCAYGIPVKKDNLYFEFDNKFGRPSSFRMDREASSLSSAVIAADALARSTAMREGMSLCYSVRERPNPDGGENDDLTRVFNEKVWDYPRTREVIDRSTGRTISEGGAIKPLELNKRVYDPQTKAYILKKEERYGRTWVDSPHAAPKLKAVVKRYEKMLVEGADFPLNCICLPHTDYSKVAEEVFLADFSFALSVANATALATRQPMRFPLDADGRLYLGPDVPPRFRDAAERKLDEFIGVVREESIIRDSLPTITRIPVSKTVKKDIVLKGDGSDLYIRPNQLMKAFGAYDFRAVEAGATAPIHEMAFTMDDGTLFRVTDPRLTRNMQVGEINSYLRYEKNDECRFTIKASDPDRIPEFLVALKSYLARAERVKVETRLLPEEEMRSMLGPDDEFPLDGYVRLLSSNSDEIAVEPFEIQARGSVDALHLPNRFDATDNDSVYYGKEDARDAFAGWAQFRYTLPDGRQSDWIAVKDRKLAQDIIYSNINRVYRSDTRVLPTRQVLEASLVSLAIREAGEDFRSLSMDVKPMKVDTKVVESERVAPAPQEVKKEEEEKNGTGRVFVTYYGSNAVPEDAFKVQISTSCPAAMKGEMDVCFKSMYPDFGTMVGPHKKGGIDDLECSRRYLETVLEPNKEKILSGMQSIIDTAREEGKDVYLFCNCKPGAFCHRYLVNNYLNINGIECRENPADRQLYKEGHVRLFEDVEDTPERSALVSRGSAAVLDLVGDAQVKQEAAVVAEEARPSALPVSFSRSEGMYARRTAENAQADDVDFTLQMAVDFDTPGERLTSRCAGDSVLVVKLPLKDGHLDLSAKGVAAAVQQIVNALPEDYVKGEPFGLNVAGNSMQTLSQYGSQEDFDVFAAAVALDLKGRGVAVRSFRSGGQTGIDETAVAMGVAFGAPVTVHAPADWRFRGVGGRDVKGDEAAFKARFEKDYPAIVKKAEAKLLRKEKSRKAVMSNHI